ncbi:MAG: glycosyltransferase family 2 protein [Aeromonas sp.]
MSITGVIITLNEEKNIEDCILSLKNICNEIIVVDSGSHDNTVEKAKKLGARVFHQTYLGDGPQKNFGLQHATNDWVFSLDADERLTPEIINEINQLSLDEQKVYDGFAMRRRNYIGSRWIKRCGWYPDYCTRLYNRKLTQFKDVKQHSFVEAKKVNQLHNDIIHYSFNNVGELFSKSGRNYSTRSAKILYKKGRKVNAFTPLIHGLNSFIREYFFQLGILAGTDGLSISLSAALNSYLKYAKLLEYQRDKKVLDEEDFNKIW